MSGVPQSSRSSQKQDTHIRVKSKKLVIFDEWVTFQETFFGGDLVLQETQPEGGIVDRVLQGECEACA